MPPDPDAIDTLAHAVKDAVVDGYAAVAEPLPAWRTVTYRQPSWDCEGLYVYIERTFPYEGNVVQEALQPIGAAAGFLQRGATVNVLLLRCVSTIAVEGFRPVVPSVAKNEDEAAQIYRDVSLVVSILGAAQKAGTLAGCNALAFEDWRSQASEGLAGGLHRLRAGVG